MTSDLVISSARTPSLQRANEANLDVKPGFVTVPDVNSEHRPKSERKIVWADSLNRWLQRHYYHRGP